MALLILPYGLLHDLLYYLQKNKKEVKDKVQTAGRTG
jgi:hypothetical protein